MPSAAASAAAAACPRAASPLELLRWLQAHPAVHLVSKRLPAAPPAFPQGLALHDAAIARSALQGRSEDALLAEDAPLARGLRRGLSIAEAAGGSGATALVRRGLPKFFDLDVGALAGTLRPSGDVAAAASSSSRGGASRTRELVANSFAEQLQGAWAAGRSVRILKLGKANGENAQVSFLPATQQWALCSKNVALLAAAPAEAQLPQWGDRRYRFARSVAELWFEQLRGLDSERQETLREVLSSRTLVGELIGSSAHLVDYGGERALRWFAVVPNGEEELCWPPGRSLRFFRRLGLPAVSAELVGSPCGYSAPEEFLSVLHGVAHAIERAPLAEEGEGCVLYLVAGSPANSEDESQTLCLGKLKTAEYRLLRRMREKAKHFARGAGSVLVEEVAADFRAEAAHFPVSASRAEEHARSLERLCRYVYAEDVPPEVVDEAFLDVLARARGYSGAAAAGPRPPAPALCVVAPPLLAGRGLLRALWAAGGAEDQPSVERLHADGLSAAWHRSAASQFTVYLNHVPFSLERALLHAPKVEAEDPAPHPRKRRRAESAEERHVQSRSRVAEGLKRQRCLFVLWGWSEEACAESLALAAEPMHSSRDAPLTREASTFLRRSAQLGPLLKKWRQHVERLRGALPAARTLWLPSAPSLGDQRSLATIAGRLDAMRRASCSSTAPAVLTVVLPVGLPGMGKSSLLEGLFRACGSRAATVFRHGQREEAPKQAAVPEGQLPPPPGAEDAKAIEAVALVSSDALTGAELEALGVTSEACSEAELAQCRRRASQSYRREVEAFVRFVGSDVLQKALSGEIRDPSRKGPLQYVLLLDKNHPPSALRREAEQLSSMAPADCEVQLKSLVLSAEPATSAPHAFEREEEREFGPWRYPWSQEALVECASRLLLRSRHETLTAGTTALYVLLSFLQLHRGQKALGKASGVTPVYARFVAVTGELASWPDAGPESAWRRFEVRALLREALAVLQPFGDPEPLEPLLAALVKCLGSAGLRSPPTPACQANVERCSEGLLSDVLAPAAPQEGFLPGVRFAALSVEAHHAALDAALQSAADAMSEAGGQDPFPRPPFERPSQLHLTLLYLGGGAAPSERSRQLLASSRQLLRRAARFDCTVTHIVCARGALACAVVDLDRLKSSGVPLEADRPHVTLCTRAPWRPKHSGDVLAAVAPLLAQVEGSESSAPRADAPAAAAPAGSPDFAGRRCHWFPSTRVGDAVLDVFVVRLERPLMLVGNPIQLY